MTTPYEWKYLSQYHGFSHPLAGTPAGQYFGIPLPRPPPPPFVPGGQRQQQQQSGGGGSSYEDDGSDDSYVDVDSGSNTAYADDSPVQSYT